MPSIDFIVKNGLIVTDNAAVNGTGSIKIAAGTTAERPAGVAGDLRFNTETNIFEGYDGTEWTDFRGYTGSASTEGGANVEISPTAPVSPVEGDLWWDEDDGRLYIYYNDGDSSQWVEAAPATQGPVGYTGSRGERGVYGWARKTANYTAQTLDAIIADTSGGPFTITLPVTPSAGDTVIISDGGDFSTNNLTVARNGSTIEGVADNFVLDIKNVKVDFVYDGTTWQVFPTITTANQPDREVENIGTITSGTIDLTTGNVFSDAPSANVTYVFSNPPETGFSYGFTLKITPSANVTITWPTEVDWPLGVAPSAPASGETDIFVFYTQNEGNTWYGFVAGDNMS